MLVDESVDLSWVNLDQSIPCEVCDNVATVRVICKLCVRALTICDPCIDKLKDRLDSGIWAPACKPNAEASRFCDVFTVVSL